VRGTEPFALQRIDWSGITPFEVKEINIKPDGFLITFTLPVDPETAANPANYDVSTYTHIYGGGYGSPEVDQTTPKVLKAGLRQPGSRPDHAQSTQGRAGGGRAFRPAHPGAD